MKRLSLLHSILLAGCVAAGAQIVAPSSDGYVARARAMLGDQNYVGCVDQLDAVDPAALTAAQAEEAAWLRASAQAHLDRSAAVGTLVDFLHSYGASTRRTAAQILLADCLLDTNPARALEIYDTVDADLLAAPEAAALRYHTAYACLLGGDTRRAADLFARAAADRQWRSQARFYLGYIAYLDHRHSEALDLLRQADRSSQPGSMADYYIAQIQYVEGNYDDALRAARALLQSPAPAPEGYRDEALRIAGESLFQLGKTAEAIPMLRRYASEAHSPLLSTLYILGTAEFGRGDYEEAVETLRPVSEAAPDAMTQSAYLYIGQALLKQHKDDAALLAFEKAMKMDFDRDVQEAAFYNNAVARFAGARTPFGSSASTFEEYLRLYPGGKYAPEVQEYLVAGYLADSNYEQALASINRMKAPSDAVLAAKQKVLYALGNRALAAGDPAKAAEYLRQADRLSSRDKAVAAQVDLSLGEALYRTGQFKESAERTRAYLKAAPAADPNRPVAFYDLGYTLFALRDYAEAAKQFEKFIASPGTATPEATVADAYNRLGDARLYSGRLDDAASAYARSSALLPSAGDYPLYQTGLIQGYRRQNRDKIATMARLLDDFPTSALVPDALLQTTEAYIQLGDNESAITTYRRLVDAYPNTEQGRRGYLQMALTQLNAGRRAEAVDSYKAVVRLYPSSDEAAVAVDELKRLAADDGSLPALTRWLATVDGAPRLDAAETDALTFEAAEKAWLTLGKPERLQAYLIDYPDGRRRPQALGYLMEEAANAGRANDALSLASEIVEKYPHSRLVEQALLTKADAEHSLGRGGDALRSYEELLSRASSATVLTAARLGTLRVARDLGDWPRVSRAADDLLASSTEGTGHRNEAIFSRALAADMLGHSDDARRQWAEIAPLADDLYGAKSAYFLAQSFLDAGDVAKARKTTEDLIDSATPHTYWLARAFILLSDICAREGNKFEAREYLNSLRENYPGNETDIFQMIDSRLSAL